MKKPKTKTTAKPKAAIQPITGARPNEETHEARQARWAAYLGLDDLDEPERAFLAVCQDIYRRDKGCFTPFEQFFLTLVVSDEVGVRPSPDRVQQELDTFRMNWDDMMRTAGEFVQAYDPRPPAEEVGLIAANG